MSSAKRDRGFLLLLALAEADGVLAYRKLGGKLAIWRRRRTAINNGGIQHMASGGKQT